MLRWSRLRWRAPTVLPVRGVRTRPHMDKIGTTYTEIVGGQEIERTVFQTRAEMAAMDARARREVEAMLARGGKQEEIEEEAEEIEGEVEVAVAEMDVGVEEMDMEVEVEVESDVVVRMDSLEAVQEQDDTEADTDADTDADAEADSPPRTANYRVRKEMRLVHGHEVETEIYNFPAPGQSVEEMEAEDAGGERVSAFEDGPRADVAAVRSLDGVAGTPGATPAATLSAASPYRFSTDAPATERGYDVDISIDIEADADAEAEYTVEIGIEAEPHTGPHGTARQHQRWMERHLAIEEGGVRTSDVETPLRAAHAYLDSQEGDVEERSEAYWRFLREFLKHPLGGRPALDLVRRQAAERVPFTVKGAITAFKAARNFRPVLRELLPILPAEMTTELIYIFAVALVNEQRVPPDAVRLMIGQSLAAVREDRAIAASTQASPPVGPTDTLLATSGVAAPMARETQVASRTQVPSIEWTPELFFPVLLAYMPHADFRGALGTLNELRAAARMQRERAIAAGEEWPGTHAQSITKCYTAVMSLWLRSQLAGGEGAHRGRVGRRLGSAVPHRLAVDLGNLLAPASTSGPAEPIHALSRALDAADSAGRRDGRYHFRNAFLAAWLNAERVAGNAGTASGVWSLLTGQSVAASLAGHRPPRPPSPEGYAALFRLLRQYPPSSYRPVVASALQGEITTGLLNSMLSAASFVPKRARTDWAALNPPWEDGGRQGVRAPPPAPAPDLALLLVLAEEHTHLLDHQSVNILCAALLRAARLAVQAEVGGPGTHVLLASPAAALTKAEWKWLEQSLWDTEVAEAQRSGRAAHKPPPIPVDAADLWDTERWRGQMEGEGRAHWLLVDLLVRPLRRQLVEGMISMARARGRGGSNAEVFSATLRELQDDMNEGTEAGGGPRAVGTGRAPGVPSLEGVAEIAEEMGLAVPPPAFVRGRKDGVWGKSGRGRRKGMSRSAGRKSALDAFFDMMDGEE